MKKLLLAIVTLASFQVQAAGVGTLQLCPRNSCGAPEYTGQINDVLVARLSGQEVPNNWQVTLVGTVGGKTAYCYPLKNASFADAQAMAATLSSFSASGKKLLARCSSPDPITPNSNNVYLVTPVIFHTVMQAAQ